MSYRPFRNIGRFLLAACAVSLGVMSLSAQAPSTTAPGDANPSRIDIFMGYSYFGAHGQIKPGNLRFRDGQVARVKVLDFGIARGGSATRAPTQTGLALGTLGYVAPEQARGEREVDARADVFSLGCVLFECLTGQRAFQGPDLVATLAKILFQETPRVSIQRTEPSLCPARCPISSAGVSPSA